MEIMLKNKCCLYVVISIRFFSITICNLLIEFPSYYCSSIGCYFLPDLQATAQGSSVSKGYCHCDCCLAPVIDCQTSTTRGIRRNIGRASGGALGRRLSVKQGEEHSIHTNNDIFLSLLYVSYLFYTL